MHSVLVDSRRLTQHRRATSKLSLLAAAAPAQPAQVDHERMLQADRHPGDWMGTGRDYGEQRFVRRPRSTTAMSADSASPGITISALTAASKARRWPSTA